MSADPYTFISVRISKAGQTVREVPICFYLDPDEAARVAVAMVSLIHRQREKLDAAAVSDVEASDER